MLRVRVAEVQRTVLKQFGINRTPRITPPQISDDVIPSVIGQ
jgi:Flp pilus assembly secretin CpaC